MADQSGIHEKTFSLISDERIDALQQLTVFFKSLPDRKQALEDILRLCSDEDKTLGIKSINAFETVFPELSDREKEKSWNSLLKLIGTDVSEIWKAVALALVFTFGYLPKKGKAWNSLLRMTEDENRRIREHAIETLILLSPSMMDKGKVWADFITLTESRYGEIRELASDAFILMYPYVKNREKVWESLLKLAESRDSHVRDMAEDIMARVFHQLPDQQKAMNDVESLTMRRMDYAICRAVKVLREDYPGISEAENPAEELYKLATEKAPFARWKASGTAGKEQETASKKV